MPVYYVDGQSQGNEQNSLPRKAKIAIAEAEYYALLKALELIAEKATGKVPGNIGEALVRSDSKLVVNQVNGEWRVEDEKLIELSEKARDLIKDLGSIRLEWVPRDENYAGLWLEGKLKPFSVEQLRW